MLVLVVLALSGCGWKSDGLERLEELYPAKVPVVADAGSTAAIDIGTPQCSGFDGTWAVRLVQNGTVSPAGEPWKIVVTDLFLAESAGQSLALRFCDQQSVITPSGTSGPSDLGRTRVPPALEAALARRPLTLTLPGDGTFRAEKLVWLWGLKGVADPVAEVLPTKDNYVGDARVFDEDGDGKPGVTLDVIVPAGGRYLVRRAIWSFAQGKLTFDNQWITGALTSSITENGLDATTPLLLIPSMLMTKPEGTHYQLRCVGQTYACGSLAKDHAQLFKDAPR